MPSKLCAGSHLRDVLNGFIPDLVSSDGYITDPGAFIENINLNVSWTPCDLTGLEYVSCNLMNLGFDPGVEVTAFPSFPAVSGTSSLFQIWNYTGTDLPALPLGLEALIIDAPTQLQNWTLDGTPAQPILAVEINNFPATSAWPSSISYVEFISVVNSEGDQPFILGDGVLRVVYLGLPNLTVLPMLSPDQDYMEIGSCPSITSGWAVQQVANNPTLIFSNMDGLQTLSNFPTLVDSLSVVVTPVLTSLPMPSSLVGLNLDYVPLLPVPIFPAGLRYLSVGWVDWNAVPALPSMLETFKIIGASTDVLLPVFPNSLWSFIADGAFTNGIPQLPSGLRQLDLTGLSTDIGQPAFPSAIETIALNDCSFTGMPSFPEGLQELIVYNSGTCLPPLPTTLTELSADMACYPNQPSNLVQQLNLCSILTSYCSEVNPTISGHVFLDLNSDGEQGADEPNHISGTVRFLPSNYQTGVDTAGNYSIALPIGEYTVELVGLSQPFSDVLPLQYVQELLTVNDNIDGLDFAISALDIPVERSVQMRLVSPARPGFDHYMIVNGSIQGSHEDTTVVTITFDPLLTLNFVRPFGTSTVTGNVITYKTPPMTQFYSDIVVSLHVPETVTMGTILMEHCEISPLTNDPNPVNNSITIYHEVLSSFDPNDKQVFPTMLAPDEVAADTTVEYMIRFQNTGTYLAERVLVTDTLSDDLQWDSFRFIQSSHPCEWFMRDGVLHFVFNEIMLPDSNANEPESHGFVSFSIRPNTDLALGETVQNIANIYFDFNEPVITDPCELTIDISNAVPSVIAQEASAVYPIPALDHITVILPNGSVYQGEVIATDGRVVQRVSAVRTNDRINVASLSPGTYVIILQSAAGGILREQFIKQ
ncbi:MAG: T9SS type A sorting domain-containing protein [Flavobacteriales bacterium]|nr:T9SS type A sorting domain-containing protein [Flavobacteriales bacterium]